MSDIVKQLRRLAKFNTFDQSVTIRRAADEIERLRGVLTAALRVVSSYDDVCDSKDRRIEELEQEIQNMVEDAAGEDI